MASIDRTAYPRFKRLVSGRELAGSFTPSDAEVASARSHTTSEVHVLVLLVWLKSYQRLGYFPKLADVPEVVVAHVSSAAGLGSEVAAVERDSPRTAKWHRQLIREYFGVVYEPARVRAVAEAAIRAAAQTKDNPADLINVALEELVRQSCGLPGYTTLDATTATIRTEVNTGFYTAVATRIGPPERSRLARLPERVSSALAALVGSRRRPSAKSDALGERVGRIRFPGLPRPIAPHPTRDTLSHAATQISRALLHLRQLDAPPV
ncbi:DUF4158 domain-containing protein [Nocardia sp. NPDC004123]